MDKLPYDPLKTELAPSAAYQLLCETAGTLLSTADRLDVETRQHISVYLGFLFDRHRSEMPWSNADAPEGPEDPARTMQLYGLTMSATGGLWQDVCASVAEVNSTSISLENVDGDSEAYVGVAKAACAHRMVRQQLSALCRRHYPETT